MHDYHLLPLVALYSAVTLRIFIRYWISRCNLLMHTSEEIPEGDHLLHDIVLRSDITNGCFQFFK